MKDETFSIDLSEGIDDQPNQFLKKVNNLLQKKNWILSQIHYQTELPVLLFEKHDSKLAITASKNKTKTIATLVAVSTDKNKLDDLKRLLKESASASLLEI